ncbi:hypothetical protein N9L76_05155 [bacterium]|nr:hypothetical protein [bacterium]
MRCTPWRPGRRRATGVGAFRPPTTRRGGADALSEETLEPWCEEAPRAQARVAFMVNDFKKKRARCACGVECVDCASTADRN